jgi:hypothetical protein
LGFYRAGLFNPGARTFTEAFGAEYIGSTEVLLAFHIEQGMVT